jgi:hypothetical protein
MSVDYSFRCVHGLILASTFSVSTSHATITTQQHTKRQCTRPCRLREAPSTHLRRIQLPHHHTFTSMGTSPTFMAVTVAPAHCRTIWSRCPAAMLLISCWPVPSGWKDTLPPPFPPLTQVSTFVFPQATQVPNLTDLLGSRWYCCSQEPSDRLDSRKTSTMTCVTILLRHYDVGRRRATNFYNGDPGTYVRFHVDVRAALVYD